jgi:hypothetical protein
MIRKSGHRFSEKIMLKQKVRAGDDSKKSHPALAAWDRDHKSAGPFAPRAQSLALAAAMAQ